MRYLAISILLLLLLVSCNPFAPELDDSSGESSSLLSDQKDPDGVFQNLKYAYTFRDTSIYGQLFDGNFTFLYPDYDQGGAEITWGRDVEMRTADGLFKTVQRLDLIWNNIVDQSINKDSTSAYISRGFNLTVTFRADDIIRVDGYASLQLIREGPDYPWMIIRWHDDSNH
ncbi:MAG: hypothetical protein JXA06_08885 [Bacteroidetes bacterium]|nr:hypothetical protein [Bacteroidota bacterium]